MIICCRVSATANVYLPRLLTNSVLRCQVKQLISYNRFNLCVYKQTIIHLLCAYFGGDVGVVIVLQQQRCGFDVVFLGGDVQRREMYLSTGVVLQ